MSKERHDAGERARRQHGVITADPASSAGRSTGQVRALVDSGMGKRRWREAFTVAGAASFEADVMVACVAGGPHAMACRGTVARLLGLGRPYFDQAGIEISIPRGASARAARSVGATVHVHRRIDDADRAVIGPIPATSAARLVVDLLGVTPVEAVYALADDLLQRRWTTPAAIRSRWIDARAVRRDVLDAVLLPWDTTPHAGTSSHRSAGCACPPDAPT